MNRKNYLQNLKEAITIKNHNMDEIVKYSSYKNVFLDHFIDAFYDCELKYSCKDLFNAGVDNEKELEEAILKSMKVIKKVGLSPKQHFKHFYVTNIETGEIYNDWHMSKMALSLVLMHVSGNTPLLNKIKIEMVKLLYE